MAIPAAALLIPAIMKAGTGIWQLAKGSQFAKEERPEFNIPQSAKDALEIAKSTATQRELPGQDIMEANMRSATAGGISRMTEVSDSPAMLLGNISKMVSGENQQRNQLGVSAANYYQQNQRALQSALNQFGQYELQKWQYDEAKPYDEAMKAAAMMREGGLQNISGALGSAVGGLVGYEQNKEWMDIMRKMYEKPGDPTGTTGVGDLGVETGKLAAQLLNDSTSAEMPLSPAEMKSISVGNFEDVFPGTKINSTSVLSPSILQELGLSPQGQTQEQNQTVGQYGGGVGGGSAVGSAVGNKAIDMLISGGFSGGAGGGSAMGSMSKQPKIFNAPYSSTGEGGGSAVGNMVKPTMIEPYKNMSGEAIYNKLKDLEGSSYWSNGQRRYTKEEVIELLKDENNKLKALKDLAEIINIMNDPETLRSLRGKQ